jgi:hypothetical protein
MIGQTILRTDARDMTPSTEMDARVPHTARLARR